MLNKFFPAYFPSEEAYSNLLKTRKDSNIYQLPKNLQSYISHPIYQPYHFFQAMLKDENLQDIIPMFLQCPKEANMLLCNLRVLLILPEAKKRIEIFEYEFVSKLIPHQIPKLVNQSVDRETHLENYMIRQQQQIDYLSNALNAHQKTLSELQTFIANNNYASSPDLSNTHIKGKFTAEVLNSKVGSQERY